MAALSPMNEIASAGLLYIMSLSISQLHQIRRFYAVLSYFNDMDKLFFVKTYFSNVISRTKDEFLLLRARANRKCAIVFGTTFGAILHSLFIVVRISHSKVPMDIFCPFLCSILCFLICYRFIY